MSGNGEQNVKKNPQDEYRKKAIRLLFLRETYRRSLVENLPLNSIPATKEDLDKLKKHYSIAAALKAENELSRKHEKEYIVSQLERRKHFFPFDRNMTQFEGYTSSSWVKEFNSDQWWIATRMPQELLLHRFFSMFFDRKERPPDVPRYLGPIRTVVQLNDVEDGDIGPYFLQKLNTSKVVEDKLTQKESIKVTVIEQETREKENCVRRMIELRKGNLCTYFIHLQFRNWPDRGVPEQPEKFLRFIKLVHANNKRDDGLSPPIVGHCRAGIGRTGVLIAASALLNSNGREVPRYGSILGPFPPDITDRVTCGIDSLKEQRHRMVQGDKQLNFLYDFDKVVRQHSRDQPKAIASGTSQGGQSNDNIISQPLKKIASRSSATKSHVARSTMETSSSGQKQVRSSSPTRHSTVTRAQTEPVQPRKNRKSCTSIISKVFKKKPDDKKRQQS